MAETSKAQLTSDIAALFLDNATGQISPEDLRYNMQNTVDSYAHNADVRPEVLTANSLIQTLTDGATIDWDADNGLIARVTLGGNRTMNFPTNLEEGARFTIMVVQDGTGSRTLTWNSKYNWESGAPTLSTAAGALDKFDFLAFDQGGTIVGIEGAGPSTAPVT